MSVRVALSLLAVPVLAVGAEVRDDLGFGRWLMERGEYYRAVTEFERFVFFQPSSPRVAEARWLMGLALFRAGRYAEAAEVLSLVTGDGEYGFRASVYRADALFLKGDHEAAERLYREAAEGYPEESGRLALRRAWAFLMMGRFAEAVPLCDGVLALGDHRLEEEAAEVKAVALRLAAFRPLSPVLAGVLSAVVPGAGQVYVKRPGDGLVAFGSVTSLALASWALWRWDRHKELAVGLTAMGGFLYAGNIYSAVSSAAFYNRRYIPKALEDLRRVWWKEF